MADQCVFANQHRTTRFRASSSSRASMSWLEAALCTILVAEPASIRSVGYTRIRNLANSGGAAITNSYYCETEPRPQSCFAIAAPRCCSPRNEGTNPPPSDGGQLGRQRSENCRYPPAAACEVISALLVLLLIVLIKRCNEDLARQYHLSHEKRRSRGYDLSSPERGWTIREESPGRIVGLTWTWASTLKAVASRATWSHRECKVLRNFPIYGCRKPTGAPSTERVRCTGQS